MPGHGDLVPLALSLRRNDSTVVPHHLSPYGDLVLPYVWFHWNYISGNVIPYQKLFVYMPPTRSPVVNCNFSHRWSQEPELSSKSTLISGPQYNDVNHLHTLLLQFDDQTLSPNLKLSSKMHRPLLPVDFDSTWYYCKYTIMIMIMIMKSRQASLLMKTKQSFRKRAQLALHCGETRIKARIV